MKILAIDPGPESSQWLVYDTEKRKVWNTDHVSNDTFPILGVNVDLVAIEMIASYGMAVGRDVFETCVFIGRLMEQCSRLFTPPQVLRVYRKDIKLELCGTTRAKDANVRQALIDKLGAPGTKKNPGPTYGVSGHAWAALAVAWYAGEMVGKGRTA